MSHPQQVRFVNLIRSLIVNKPYAKVLEIGSYDVNGAIRSIFDNANKYIGVDLIPGPGVDVVSSGDRYRPALDGEKYDLVISCECFEHNPYWSETLKNMISLTSQDGVVAFSCATTGRLEHGTKRTSEFDSPGSAEKGWDYYKNLKARDIKAGVPELSSLKCYRFFINKNCSDLYFIGAKADSLLDFSDLDNFFSTLRTAEKEILFSDRGSKSFLSQLSSRFVYLMALILPDRLFQEFALFYYKNNKVFKYFIKR